MISDELARQLHDKATRGVSLSPAEHARLQEWHAVQDQAESQLLSPRSADPVLASLRSQVDSALEQVGSVTRNIRQLSAENDSLRREIAELRRQLAARRVSQPG